MALTLNAVSPTAESELFSARFEKLPRERCSKRLEAGGFRKTIDSGLEENECRTLTSSEELYWRPSPVRLPLLLERTRVVGRVAELVLLPAFRQCASIRQTAILRFTGSLNRWTDIGRAMIIVPEDNDRWRLLTWHNVAVRRLWGWGYSIQKILAASEPKPRESASLVIASDFGGEHKHATHLIYCYLLVRGDMRDWLSSTMAVRSHLTDTRRMAYKRLDDPLRQNALIPFLSAAAGLDGHLVAIAIDKKKKWLSTAPGASDRLLRELNLKATWNARALEGMLRKVHITAILLSLWSRPYSNVTWITDQDEFVANDLRHDDALLAAARYSSFYIDHPMGVFRLNTTGQDVDACDFEDLCAIPDLAAGMLSDVTTRLRNRRWEDRLWRLSSDLPLKAEVIADWFWDESMALRKTLISIDVHGTKFGVRKVSMVMGAPDQASAISPDDSQ